MRKSEPEVRSWNSAFVVSQFLSGLTYGVILFLVASGLSLIFGVMNILNFAHATLWLVGAYFSYSFWSVMQEYAASPCG